MRIKRYSVKFLLVFILTLIFSAANAQCDPFFDPFCEDVDVPLDNEVIFAMVISGALGCWFILKKKLPQTQNN